jgi:3-phenylpropionate/trans-cinnamate dioxygenase ferredoxin reductase component
MSQVFAIIGAGHCAGQAAASLRQQGFDGEIVIIGEEPHIPYQRPPLSKKFLVGELPLERVYLRPLKFYQDNNVELLLDTRAVALDPQQRRLAFADGTQRRYDKLLLATGSRPRRLAVAGVDLPGVCYLRTIADAQRIQAYMQAGKSLVVIGGGYIGLEVSAVGVQRGMRVTLLEAADRVLGRVTAPAMSDFFTKLHGEHGVDIRCNARVLRFEGSDHVAAVTCDDARIEADLVVIGIGILPNVELAQSAGLPCDNGIIVDEYCRSGDARIFAAGDCSNHPNPLLQCRLRLESVHNAVEQGKTAAANMCGKGQPYSEIPWFWSDQYDVKLQMVGIADGYDQLVQRGRTEERAFALFYLKDGVLIAVDAINNPREYMACKKLVPQRMRIAPERLADTTIAMHDMV